MSGSCPSYVSWSWSTFIPESGRIVCETTTGTPSSSQQAGALDDLGQAELKYCIALGDWWRAVKKEKERTEGNVIRHQIGGDDSWSAHRGGGPRMSIVREHRLIRDAEPDMQPSGYFDRTVEVR